VRGDADEAGDDVDYEGSEGTILCIWAESTVARWVVTGEATGGGSEAEKSSMPTGMRMTQMRQVTM